MNRRGFLESMLKAGVAAAFLPAATTYARRWVMRESLWVVGEPTTIEVRGLKWLSYEVKELRSGFTRGISALESLPHDRLVMTGKWGMACWKAFPSRPPCECPVLTEPRIDEVRVNFEVIARPA